MAKKRAYRKKRKTGRRTRRRRTVAHPQNWLTTAFPKTTAVRLLYHDIINMPYSPGTISKYFFRANGPFDPDTSIGGHQPLAFDQWGQFYNHVVVAGSRIDVTIVDSTVGQNGGGIMGGVQLSDDTSTPTVLTTFLEQPTTRYKSGSNYNNGNMGGNSAIKVSGRFSAKKFFNVTNIKDNIGRIGSTVSDTPQEEAIFTIWYSPFNQLRDLDAYIVHVKISYMCIFSEPRELRGS